MKLIGVELNENLLASPALRDRQAVFCHGLGMACAIQNGLTGGDQVSFHGLGLSWVGAGCYNPKALLSEVAVFGVSCENKASSSDLDQAKFIRESVPSRCFVQFFG